VPLVETDVLEVIVSWDGLSADAVVVHLSAKASQKLYTISLISPVFGSDFVWSKSFRDKNGIVNSVAETVNPENQPLGDGSKAIKFSY
jgi:hypothetical protein